MAEDHFLNILKIISVDDYDEIIVDKIHQYLQSRKILDIDYGFIHPQSLAKLDEFLANTHLTKRAADSALPYEYEHVQKEPPSR